MITTTSNEITNRPFQDQPFCGVRKNNYTPTNVFHDFTTVYLPENLQIEKLLLQYSYPEGMTHLQNPSKANDKIKLILGKAYNYFIKDKDEDDWVKLNAEVLKSIDNNYKPIIDWADIAGIIEIDPNFKEGLESCKYKFNPKYSTKTIPHHLYNSVIVKKFRNYGVCPITVKKHQLLYADLLRTSIDIEEANTILKDIKGDIYKKVSKDKKLKRKWKKAKYTQAEIEIEIHKKVDERQQWNKDYNEKDYNEKFVDRELIFNRDKTSTRLHTNITGLKKECRKALRIGNQKKQLINSDFNNSQPFLLSTLLDADCWTNLGLMNKILRLNPGLCLNYSKHHPNHLIPNKDLIPITLQDIWSKNYSQTVQDYKKTAQAGEVYEFVYELINGEKIADLPESERKDARDSVKDLMIKVLFSPTNFNKGNKVYQQFKKCFPELTDIIEWINTGFNKTRNGVKNKDGEVVNKRGENDQTNALAILLQTMEANLFLDKMIPRIKAHNPDIYCLTVHDSIITTQEHKDIVEQIMYEVCDDYLGFRPTIDVEYL